jgi:hypothetical protein
MIPHIAKRKDHRCDLCGRRIPIGTRYWADKDGQRREYTNCLDYEKEILLPAGYNHNRSMYKGEKP